MKPVPKIFLFPDKRSKYGRRKEGNNSFTQFSTQFSNEQIGEAMKRALVRTKESIEQLLRHDGGLERKQMLGKPTNPFTSDR